MPHPSAFRAHGWESRNIRSSEERESAPAQGFEIEKPVYGGAFLTRSEGKAVFVPLALPGEKVRIRVTQNKSGYSTAELTEILEPSPERIAPPARTSAPCGGCNYQHTGYANQLTFKQAILRETLERAGVATPDEITTLSANPWAYRNRIRLAFDAQGQPGYRGRKSHASSLSFRRPSPSRVQTKRPWGAQAPTAAPQVPGTRESTKLLCLSQGMKRAPSPHRSCSPPPKPPPISSSAFPPTFAPTNCSSSATPLKARCSSPSSPRKTPSFASTPWPAHSTSAFPHCKARRFAAGGRPGHPPRTLARWGADALTYTAAGFDYRVDHGAFFQVNRWLVDTLVDAVTARQSGALAWDLFAGVGLFARRLTASFESVVAVESAPPAVDALEHNLRGTSGKPVRTTTLDFLRAAPQGIRPDLIVVDPPRTGLGAETTALLADRAAPALVYVSCDPATLARDLRALLTSGYTLQSVTLADLFPQTFHIETLVHLRRS